MIAVNGTFQYAILPETRQIDETGHPVPSATAWSQSLSCFVTATTDNRLCAYKDGTYRTVKATIYTECNVPFSADRVRVNRGDEFLGEFEVISIEPQDFAHFTKIFV